MKKRKSHAFYKDVYLLGKDKEGILYWLEAPSWECEWYWGFGYVETYTNNENPNISSDINSHAHLDHFMSEYFIEWNGSKPILENKTFSEKEGWELSELFSQFYHLKEHAEFWGRGKMNCGDVKIQNWKNKELANRINQKMIPIITAEILRILTPKI